MPAADDVIVVVAGRGTGRGEMNVYRALCIASTTSSSVVYCIKFYSEKSRD